MKRVCPTEEQEQRTVVAYLNARPDLRDWFFHVPNGGARSRVTGAKLKAAGVKRGVPDIWITRQTSNERVGLVIELKRRAGFRVDPEQQEWLDRLESQGWAAQVCLGADATISVIERMYGPPAARRPCPCEGWAKGKT